MKIVSKEEFIEKVMQSVEDLFQICKEEDLEPIGFSLIVNANDKDEDEAMSSLGVGEYVFGQVRGNWSRDDITSAIDVIKAGREQMDVRRVDMDEATGLLNS